MSRNRFKSLIQSIMFDDHQERAENWPRDRFAAIRNIFELFNKNVIPSEYLATDDTVIPNEESDKHKTLQPK